MLKRFLFITVTAVRSHVCSLIFFFFFKLLSKKLCVKVDSEGAGWIIIFEAEKRGYMIAPQPYSSVDYLRKLTEDVKAIYFLHKFRGCFNQDTTQMKLSNKIMCSNKYSDRAMLVLS